MNLGPIGIPEIIVVIVVGVPLWRFISRTGGLLFQYPLEKSLPVLFQRALLDFRTSYLLSYSPTNVRRYGSHAITVRTKSGRYKVRARKGYVE
jgi:hypothetical protein